MTKKSVQRIFRKSFLKNKLQPSKMLMYLTKNICQRLNVYSRLTLKIDVSNGKEQNLWQAYDVEIETTILIGNISRDMERRENRF